MAEDTDFAALYRELGIDATCSLTELRGAWRRRVAKLHPDQGGSAEDTGRLQQLNRLYDAALDFHGRYQRMPGATTSGHLSPDRYAYAPQQASFEAETQPSALPASGFGRISRYFVAVSLIAIAVLGWRVVQHDQQNAYFHDTDAAPGRVMKAAANSDKTHSARMPVKPLTATLTIAPGMGKDTVRDILGEPLDMHALRWTYGPSWVEFRCDKVVDWYSSPLRPLRVSAARDARTDTALRDDRSCD